MRCCSSWGLLEEGESHHLCHRSGFLKKPALKSYNVIFSAIYHITALNFIHEGCELTCEGTVYECELKTVQETFF